MHQPRGLPYAKDVASSMATYRSVKMPVFAVNVTFVILVNNKLYLNDNIAFLQELEETAIYEFLFYFIWQKYNSLAFVYLI